jgi:LysM repeat protein
MKNWSSRVWAFITTVVLALSSVVGLAITAPPAKALSGSMFDPGLIIGDSVFYDFGSMDAGDIQTFLDQQVPRCKLAPAANVGDFTCLRYYRTDIPAMAASPGRCNAIDATTDVRASKMIEIIARACNINPRVILVTLQKEQGLVTSTNPFWPDSSGNPSTTKPADYRYQIAMGFNCPDTGPCSTFGFFYQVYKAASQFHWYGNPGGSFTYLHVGRNVTINYQVASVSGCGSNTFLLKSQATAALYYYTPYTPNQAALNNLYGSGDRCSAYGNRNFWRYYWDWFGSPIGGGFLLQSATSDVYLIVPNSAGGFSKYDVPDKSLATALAPLGPVGIVSQDYLDTFPIAGNMKRIVKSATNQYYFVDNGAKYPFSSCAQVATFGLNCTDAIQLTAYQLNALATGDAMSALVTDSTVKAGGPQYLITNGVKREILDTASVRDAGITLPAAAPVPISAFSYLPWGAPIAKSGLLFTNRSTGNPAVVIGGKYYEIDPATAADMDFKKWFPWSTGTLSDLGVDAIRSGQPVKSIVTDDAGNGYVLSSAGKIAISAGSSLVQNPPAIPAELLKAIPSAGAPMAAPLLVKVAAGKTTYWVEQDTRRAVVNASSQVKLSGMATTLSVRVLPKSAVEQIDLGDPVIGPATLVQDPSGHLLLTDGLANYFTIPSQLWATEFGLGNKPEKVLKTDLTGYSSEGQLELKVFCGGVQYLAVNGTWQPMLDEYAATYPGIASVIDNTTCLALKKGTTQLGRFVISPTKQIYLLSNGKRRLVTQKQYEAIRGTTPAAFKIDSTLAAAIPIGSPMPVSYKTVLVNPADAATSQGEVPTATTRPTATPTPSIPVVPTPTKLVTPTPTPTKSPTPVPTKSATPAPTKSPTPTPTKSATPTPTPSASASVRYYTVVAGDTLTKIANRYGVSIQAIKTANKMTTDVVQLGQKLIIPTV